MVVYFVIKHQIWYGDTFPDPLSFQDGYHEILYLYGLNHIIKTDETIKLYCAYKINAINLIIHVYALQNTS